MIFPCRFKSWRRSTSSVLTGARPHKLPGTILHVPGVYDHSALLRVGSLDRHEESNKNHRRPGAYSNPESHYFIITSRRRVLQTHLSLGWLIYLLCTTFAEYGTQQEHRQQDTWSLLGLAPLWGWYSAGAQATGHVVPSRPGSLMRMILSRSTGNRTRGPF